MNPVIQTDKLSKWYGNVLGLSDVSLKIEAGITGLLGPNGAGKSTFMKLMTGQLKPNIGKVLIQGERVRNNYTLFSRMGYCPEYDVFYDELTGWQFIKRMLKLYHISSPDVEKKAKKAMEIVELMQDKDRVIRSYSRGMRQRLKFAQAIAHEPEILLLDEPLNGLDPLGRRKLIQLIKAYRDEGKSIIISSHVLPEIEVLTNKIVLIHQGKIFAQGDIHYIRDLIENHPHMISIICSNRRKFASKIIKEEYVLKIEFGKADNQVMIETNDRDKFFSRLPSVLMNNDIRVEEITSPDDNLQAVFDYLIGK